MIIRMRTKVLALAAAATLLAACQEADRVDALMSQMTTEEKIGQLNLLPGGDITTGAVMNSPWPRR